MLAQPSVAGSDMVTSAGRTPGHTAKAAVAGPATLVFIASAGHSGSTLLDLLLGNHSGISSAGEMNRLTLHAADRVCACGATVIGCSFWNSVRATIAEQRNYPSLITWDQYHTDIPPQKPLLQVDVAAAQLVDGARVPPELRRRMAEAGVAVSERATLSRRGTRDFKWHLTDSAAHREYVLRTSKDRIDVYDATVRWKNPVRLIPEPLEIALALGMPSVLEVVRACSPTAAKYAQIAENSWAVADAMAAVNATRFVIDSSKSPVRLKLLYMLRPDRVRVVHLVRDGRAVTASAMRRRDMSASAAARIWKRDNRNLGVMLKTIPERSKIGVRYEALCEDPGREIKRVCEFLELEFEPEMLALWGRAVHNIPGNPMLFNRSDRAITKDERWRRDLSNHDIQAFERAAGRLNRSLGYA
jgi:hypothetical protein